VARYGYWIGAVLAVRFEFTRTPALARSWQWRHAPGDLAGRAAE
jgi:hypothetical protein